MKKKFEKLGEAFLTGAGVNMVLGSLGMVIIQFLFSLPNELKTLLWWFGGLVIAIALGYGIQKYFERREVSWVVVGGGIAIGVFLMMITSSVATLFFPYLNTAPLGGFEGYVDVSEFLFPFLVSSVILLGLFSYIVVREY